jgi:hypothetical protein
MTRECDLRKTEIQDLGTPTLGDKNVGRFDVAVDDAFAMGGIESIGNLDGQTQQDIGRDGFLRDAMLQRLAVERLHHNKSLAALFADVVNSADIWVIQR